MYGKLFSSPHQKVHPYPYGHRPPRPLPKPDNEKIIALSVTLALTILTAIIVPLAAILPPALAIKLPINIIVPIYTHPNPGAWDKLFASCVPPETRRTTCKLESTDLRRIIKYPDTNFTVIVNPTSGPGTPPFPAAQYIEAITRLKIYDNVRTVGYINTKGGKRDIGTVNHEVGTYSGWSGRPDLALNGIFFDQTPSTGSIETNSYLNNISATVKHSKFNSPNLVIHSPGSIPSEELKVADLDITIICEGEFGDIPPHEEFRRKLGKLSTRRENYGVLLHSLPEELGRIGVRKVIDELRKDVQYVFMTDRTEKVYEGFGTFWEDFVDLSWW